ncbi:hypothetical protein [Mycolicibacterium brisbanense]
MVELIADVSQRLNSGNATLADQLAHIAMNWRDAPSTFRTEDLAGEPVVGKMRVATQIICSFCILPYLRPRGRQL